MGSARDGLAHALVDDLCGEVLGPAVGTKPVATLYARHHLWGERTKGYYQLYLIGRKGGRKEGSTTGFSGKHSHSLPVIICGKRTGVVVLYFFFFFFLTE